jgi:hypothetical protein
MTVGLRAMTTKQIITRSLPAASQPARGARRLLADIKVEVARESFRAGELEHGLLEPAHPQHRVQQLPIAGVAVRHRLPPRCPRFARNRFDLRSF